jgi:hypothetical protein
MSEHNVEQQAADNAAAAADNENLRAQLAHERGQLEQQLAETRAQASGGLTDADIRRLEHPEEFDGDDAGDGDADADDEPASIAPVAPAATTGPAGFAQTPAGIPPASEPEHDVDAAHEPAHEPTREPTLLERMLGKGGQG